MSKQNAFNPALFQQAEFDDRVGEDDNQKQLSQQDLPYEKTGNSTRDQVRKMFWEIFDGSQENEDHASKYSASQIIQLIEQQIFQICDNDSKIRSYRDKSRQLQLKLKGPRFSQERSQLRQGILSIETVCSEEFLNGKSVPIQKSQNQSNVGQTLGANGRGRGSQVGLPMRGKIVPPSQIMLGRGRGGPFPTSQKPQMPILKKFEEQELKQEVYDENQQQEEKTEEQNINIQGDTNIQETQQIETQNINENQNMDEQKKVEQQIEQRQEQQIDEVQQPQTLAPKLPQRGPPQNFRGAPNMRGGFRPQARPPFNQRNPGTSSLNVQNQFQENKHQENENLNNQQIDSQKEAEQNQTLLEFPEISNENQFDNKINKIDLFEQNQNPVPVKIVESLNNQQNNENIQNEQQNIDIKQQPLFDATLDDSSEDQQQNIGHLGKKKKVKKLKKVKKANQTSVQEFQDQILEQQIANLQNLSNDLQQKQNSNLDMPRIYVESEHQKIEESQKENEENIQIDEDRPLKKDDEKIEKVHQIQTGKQTLKELNEEQLIKEILKKKATPIGKLTKENLDQQFNKGLDTYRENEYETETILLDYSIMSPRAQNEGVQNQIEQIQVMESISADIVNDSSMIKHQKQESQREQHILNNMTTNKSKSLSHSQIANQDSEAVRRMQEALNSKKDTINELNLKILQAQSEISLLHQKYQLVQDENLYLKDQQKLQKSQIIEKEDLYFQQKHQIQQNKINHDKIVKLKDQQIEKIQNEFKIVRQEAQIYKERFQKTFKEAQGWREKLEKQIQFLLQTQVSQNKNSNQLNNLLQPAFDNSIQILDNYPNDRQILSDNVISNQNFGGQYPASNYQEINLQKELNEMKIHYEKQLQLQKQQLDSRTKDLQTIKKQNNSFIEKNKVLQNKVQNYEERNISQMAGSGSNTNEFFMNLNQQQYIDCNQEDFDNENKYIDQQSQFINQNERFQQNSTIIKKDENNLIISEEQDDVIKVENIEANVGNEILQLNPEHGQIRAPSINRAGYFETTQDEATGGEGNNNSQIQFYQFDDDFIPSREILPNSNNLLIQVNNILDQQSASALENNSIINNSNLNEFDSYFKQSNQNNNQSSLIDDNKLLKKVKKQNQTNLQNGQIDVPLQSVIEESKVDSFIKNRNYQTGQQKNDERSNAQNEIYYGELQNNLDLQIGIQEQQDLNNSKEIKLQQQSNLQMNAINNVSLNSQQKKSLINNQNNPNQLFNFSKENEGIIGQFDQKLNQQKQSFINNFDRHSASQAQEIEQSSLLIQQDYEQMPQEQIYNQNEIMEMKEDAYEEEFDEDEDEDDDDDDDDDEEITEEDDIMDEMIDDESNYSREFRDDESQDSAQDSQDSQDHPDDHQERNALRDPEDINQNDINLMNRVPGAGSGFQMHQNDRRAADMGGISSQNQHIGPGAIPSQTSQTGLNNIGKFQGSIKQTGSMQNGLRFGTHGNMPHQFQQNSQHQQYGTGSSGASGNGHSSSVRGMQNQSLNLQQQHEEQKQSSQFNNNLAQSSQNGANEVHTVSASAQGNTGSGGVGPFGKNQNQRRNRRGNRQQNQQPSSGANGGERMRINGVRRTNRNNRQSRQAISGGVSGSSQILASNSSQQHQINNQFQQNIGNQGEQNQFQSSNGNNDYQNNQPNNNKDQRGGRPLRAQNRGRQQRNNQQLQTININQGQNAPASTQQSSSSQPINQLAQSQSQQQLQSEPVSLSQEREQNAAQRDRFYLQSTGLRAQVASGVGNVSVSEQSAGQGIVSRTNNESQAVQQVIPLNAPASTQSYNGNSRNQQNQQFGRDQTLIQSSAIHGAAQQTHLNTQSSQMIPASTASHNNTNQSNQFTGQMAAAQRGIYINQENQNNQQTTAIPHGGGGRSHLHNNVHQQQPSQTSINHTGVVHTVSFESGSTSFMNSGNLPISGSAVQNDYNQQSFQQNQGIRSQKNNTFLPRQGIQNNQAQRRVIGGHQDLQRQNITGGVPYTQISQVSSPPSNNLNFSQNQSQQIIINRNHQNQLSQNQQNEQILQIYQNAPNSDMSGPGAVGAPPSAQQIPAAQNISNRQNFRQNTNMPSSTCQNEIVLNSQMAAQQPHQQQQNISPGSSQIAGGSGGEVLGIGPSGGGPSSNVQNHSLNRMVPLPSVPENNRQFEEEKQSSSQNQQQSFITIPSSLFGTGNVSSGIDYQRNDQNQNQLNLHQPPAALKAQNQQIYNQSKMIFNNDLIEGSGTGMGVKNQLISNNQFNFDEVNQQTINFNSQNISSNIETQHIKNRSTPPRRNNDSKKTSGANTPNRDGANTPTTHQSQQIQNMQNRVQIFGTGLGHLPSGHTTNEFGSAITVGLTNHLNSISQGGQQNQNLNQQFGGNNQQNFINNFNGSQIFSQIVEDGIEASGSSIIDQLSASVNQGRSNTNQNAATVFASTASLFDDFIENKDQNKN